jgi:hypothetical protein
MRTTSGWVDVLPFAVSFTLQVPGIAQMVESAGAVSCGIAAIGYDGFSSRIGS